MLGTDFCKDMQTPPPPTPALTSNSSILASVPQHSSPDEPKASAQSDHHGAPRLLRFLVLPDALRILDKSMVVAHGLSLLEPRGNEL